MGNKCGKSVEKQNEHEEAERLRQEKELKEEEERKLRKQKEEEAQRLLELEEQKLNEEAEVEVKEKEQQEEEVHEEEVPVLVPLKSKSVSIKSDETKSNKSNSRGQSILEELVEIGSRLNSRSMSQSTTELSDVLDVDGTLEMRTYTPFDMKKTDEIAKFVAVKCGCMLSDSHNVNDCPICQSVDLSDAPLIA